MSDKQTTPFPTREALAAEIQRLDPKLSPGDPAFEAALFVLASAVMGPAYARIASHVGVRLADARAWAANLRKSGIWTGRKVAGAAWFENGGGLDFWLAVLVAQGLVEKASR